MTVRAADSGVRLAEVMAALSLAIDVGMGQPMEQGLQTCLLAAGLAEAAGLDRTERQRIYDLALLRHVGCTADSHVFASFLGDELAFRHEVARIDFSKPSVLLPFMLRQVGAGRPPLERVRMVGRLVAHGREFMKGTNAVCEAAQLLAAGLGFNDPQLRRSLGQVYERWDGKGMPDGVAGGDLTLAVRVVQLAEGAAIFYELGGPVAAQATVAARAGAAYDPQLAATFARAAPELLAGLGAESVWDAVLAAEPVPGGPLPDDVLDSTLRAMADFADLKSPYTVGHSAGVGELAGAAASCLGLPAADALAVRRAGYVHDLGRVAVSAGIWGKPGALSRGEWEQVRLHPYYTERALARPAALAHLGALAGLHHERLDGSGYHRAAPAQALGPAARVLAAADIYHALREPRPHREALPAGSAADLLRHEARDGRIDGAAAEAVLEAAGQRPRRRRGRIAGLTAREIDVLRLVARGHSTKQIAGELVVAPKTVDAHLQHIYSKIGVSTRAAATVFAMQHDLIDPTAEPR